MVRRAKGDDISTFGVRQREMDSSFCSLGTGDFVVCAGQRATRHDVCQSFGQIVAEGVIVVKPVLPVGPVNRVKNFWMAIPQWVRCPPVLEVDIAMTI